MQQSGTTLPPSGRALATPLIAPPLASTLATTVALALVPFVLVEVFASRLDRVWSTAGYLVFHNVAELFSVLVALSVFAVAWFTHDLSRDRHTLFLGCAFLAIGLMDLMHTLSYQGMPDFVTPNSANKASQIWVGVRLLAAAAFVASAFIRPDAPGRWLGKPVLGGAALAISAAAFVAFVLYGPRLPAAFVPGVGQTPFKRSAEHVIVVLLVAAIAVHAWRFRRSRDPAVAHFVAAFALSAFSELFFAAYRSVTDTRNAMGHVYKVVAFALVYRGMFIASVQRPHRQLSDAAEALRREMAERGRAEEQLRRSQKMEAVGRLAGGVAHDFNNLLTAILGATEELLEGLSAGSPLRAAAEDVQLAAQKAAGLTQQLLTFGRRQVVARRVVALDALVAGLVQMLKRLIGDDVELVAAPAPGLGKVRADPGQLEQVIVNLVVNARDAMSGGGRITVEAANAEVGPEEARGQAGVQPGPHVVLSVADTGTGMDAEVLSHLFEPFFTTKGPGKGTGLGLSTLYGIVRQAGGHVRVESRVGAGSVFRVYLPRVEEGVEAAAPPPRPAAGARLPASVLLAEDEARVRSVIRKVLGRAGHAVLEAADGEEALRLAADPSRRIDLLVTDVVMPRLGGRELAARVRALHPGVKVLYISGYAGPDFPVDDLGEGARFLQKPFSPAALADEVGRLLTPAGPRPPAA